MNASSKTILLVEDNPAHARLMLRNLRETGPAAGVFHVNNGEAALDYLFRRGEYEDPQESPRPDVILLDLRMPRVDGLDVLKAVKSDDRVRDIPVVVLTTSGDRSDIKRAYHLHANAYLVKPIDFGMIAEMLRSVETFWLVWNRTPPAESDSAAGAHTSSDP
jgi:CheY-like chemotaxis protein